jgi:tetratricopeptide (TPR) repeat protein
MVCGHCGAVADPAASRCATCDSDLPAGGATMAPSDGSSVTSAVTGTLPAPATGLGPPDSLQPGQKFGERYTILKKLGAGGMGAVYQAWDESLGIAVALKVIRLDAATSPAETRQLEARFKRELLLARQVSHPNVVRIHDLGQLGATTYLTMAYVEGADLATVMRREGKIEVSRALSIIKQVGEGLDAAHAAGVVHRDLKPANVMIDAEGRALLTDFGIARSVDAATLHTAPGSVVGTLEYMAPEQARGETADRRTDVYSLGLIFYEVLAGGRPRSSGSGGLAELLSRIEKGPPPVGSVAPDVPPPVRAIVSRCLERDPAARYASAADFLSDLNRLAPDGRIVPTVVAPIASPKASSRPLLAVAALVLVLAIAGGGWWLRRDGAPAPADTPPDPVSVLIADFENRAGDPVFQGSLEQALALGMEGAPFVATYPRDEALKVAQTIKAGSSLDAAAAQLVAVRQEVPVVLVGTVEQEATGYTLRVSALRPGPGTNEPFATVEEHAPDKKGVLRAIDSIATRLRKALGDTPVEGVSQAESVSAASLEALHEYTVAQMLSTDRKNEEAISHYQKAIHYDPQFGRAYAGWAVSAFDLGRRAEAQEAWTRALALVDRMTEREKYRTLGGYNLSVARNYQQAIDAYRQLVEKYPADLAGQSNLALAYFYTRDFARALEYGKQAIDLYPNSIKFQNNYALYAMYAGDFKAGAESAQKLVDENPQYDAAYLPLAMAALSEGELTKAREFYAAAARTGASGASLAAIGLADIALYEGKPADAIAILEPAIAADRRARNSFGVETKSVALAEALAARTGVAAALPVIFELTARSADEFVVVPGTRILGLARREAQARELAARLQDRAQPVPRAYAHVIAGELALQKGRHSDAITAFLAAIEVADLWLARFGLSVAYVEAGRYAEAMSELEACAKRRGEATSLFFDDIPTWRYMAVLPYWTGRVQQGLNSPAATASFEQFLRIRAGATSDPLAADARQRIKAQGGAPASR